MMKTPPPSRPTNDPGPAKTDAVEVSIMVEAALPEVYRQWLQVEDFPKFIRPIKSARKLDRDHFAISAAWDGQRFDAILQIMLRVPDRRVAWRLLHDHFMAGVVSFAAHSEHRTRVTLKMVSSLGGASARRVENHLQGFKSLLEAK